MRAVSKNGRRQRTQQRLLQRRAFPPQLVCATFGMILQIILLISFDLSSINTHHRAMLFADAFASNLVETGIGCMTELSTDEVIMNEEVQPPEQSDFPKMHLAVLDGKNKPIEETTHKYDPTVSTIRIAFVNPYPTSEFNEDLQFVIEVEGKTEDSRDAEFVEGGLIGCDNNKRLSGRLLESQAAFVLQINDHASRLRVWGGWATGHNAVRLVPDLILEPGEPGSAALETTNDLSVEQQKEEIQDLEEEILEEEFQNTPKEKSLREQEEEKLEKLLMGDESDEVKPPKSQREQEEDKLLQMLQGDDAPEKKEEVEPPKSQREQEEEKLLKMLQGDDTPEKKEEDNALSGEEEVAIEDLEEEILEEEFQNTPKEKSLREQEEAKLEKLLEGDGEKAEQEEKRILRDTEDTAKTAAKPSPQRKRKNVLQKPGDAEGWIDPSKRGKDLGLEIARKDRERGRQGGNNAVGETRTIQQKLRDKQLDLEAVGGGSNNKDERKQRHKLIDHTVDRDHREIRDIPGEIEIYDDATDDDLPEVHPEIITDDYLPIEPGVDDADVRPKAAVRGSRREPGNDSPSSGLELQLVLETSRHFLACAFFAATMGLFWVIFGRKRDKGRRDL